MSTHRAALIAAIHDAPEDDDLRLVCADWFEDQGDNASVARAEFIRVQIQRARLSLSDPAHSELQARELRLLRRYAPVWCGSHFLFKKVTFRRGFIERVHLHLQHFQHHRRQLFALEPVREIRLTGWHRASEDRARRIAACAEWRFVEELHLHHQGPHKAPPGTVLHLLESPHLSRLRALHCSGLALDPDERRRFERLPLMQRIEALTLPHLTSDRPPFQNAGEWLEEADTSDLSWSSLRDVRLNLPYASAATRQRILARLAWERLESLYCSLNVEMLADLVGRLPNLRKLGFVQLNAGEASPRLIDRLVQCPLESLDLHFHRVAPDELARLFTGAQSHRLQHLTLDGVIDSEHFRVLGSRAELPGLHHLDLSTLDEISDDGAQALFGSDRLRGLTTLDLSATWITATAIRALARAPGWDRLRVLSLVGDSIEESAWLELLASANLQRLVVLSISNGSIRDDFGFHLSPAVAQALTQLPHLAYLEIHAASIDPAAREILAACPSLAWVKLELFGEEWDIQTDRQRRAPEMSPSVDLR